MGGRQVNRREFIGSAAAGASAALVGAPATAQGTARIVVIGGGFAGATCARQLKRLDPKIQVTLVETNPAFTACPFSNAVIAAFRELTAQQFTYARRARLRSLMVRASPTIALYWRPVLTSAGTRCRDIARQPRSGCRTRGRPASRRCCCAVS